jgi:Ca2+-dependent lipid-binding protein
MEAAELAKGGTSGFLNLTVCRAKLTHNTETFGAMDPYVKWVWQKKNYHTTTETDAGKEPVWQETFKLAITDFMNGDKIKFEVMDENVMKDALIGACDIPITDLVGKSGKVKVSLLYKNLDAGFIIVAPSWEHEDLKTIEK